MKARPQERQERKRDQFVVLYKFLNLTLFCFCFFFKSVAIYKLLPFLDLLSFSWAIHINVATSLDIWCSISIPYSSLIWQSLFLFTVTKSFLLRDNIVPLFVWGLFFSFLPKPYPSVVNTFFTLSKTELCSRYGPCSLVILWLVYCFSFSILLPLIWDCSIFPRYIKMLS